jgi:hypothetical protein
MFDIGNNLHFVCRTREYNLKYNYNLDVAAPSYETLTRFARDEHLTVRVICCANNYGNGFDFAIDQAAVDKVALKKQKAGASS